ncbi:hypothetical protein NrS5_26 [Nitratiruptor phage NrS-5]|uniref:hypothetical protein n=1 Tax=unclassified Nitratiruptor TaxID=2624044 RepID=UPI00191632BB|nr:MULTISPECIES: hypothetical protein [unclassified Nitratiruptor]BCD61730.1 hypothetical protein NitYY0813_C0590 [Nitratiruptor sp. YY08-13]BCD65665.1 hypothetical protein NitYY0826_C0592 [Nitratiruptor sp. YY08-26]BCD83208.1 hypothetical protein NrS4_26 [Nitratiruptor phage NrS-4]BCD83267.1 hypothetical protein NrS5_26 [Nitratiruptor phage NrS-5]
MRQAFNFYAHYDEILQGLTDIELAKIIRAILDVQFFRKHIDSITFEDRLLNIAWIGIKHSIKSQLEGYCAKHNIDYDALFNKDSEKTGISTPPKGGRQGATEGGENNCKHPLPKGGKNFSNPPCQQEQEQEKEQGKEKEQEKGGECERGKTSQDEPATLDAEVVPQKSSPYKQDATEVANYLAKRIVAYNPKAKPKPKGWIKDIELAMRVDGRSKDELLRCIDWIYETKEGNFWIPNILSGKKLREKFDTMQLQAKRSAKKEPIAVLNELQAEGWM